MKKTSAFIIILIIVLLGVRQQEVKTLEGPTPKIEVVRFNNVSDLFTTLHFPANWKENQKFLKIRSWFETEPELRSLKLDSKFNVYEEGTDFFNENYAGRVTVPSILIQKPNGDIIFAATGNNIPETSEALISKIKIKVPYSVQQYKNPYKHNSNYDKYRSKPKPTPRPIIRSIPEKSEKSKEIPYSSYLLALIGGAAYGAYLNTKSEGEENV